MSKNLVVKHNALINASYRLSLTEQRLILLSIAEARRIGVNITPVDRIFVSAEIYMKAFNTTRQASYMALKEACDNLFNREYGYTEVKEKGTVVVRSRWVSEISYNENEATVGLIFAPSIVPYITNLEQQFTSYDLEQVARLNSRYAVRLYEVIIAWRTKGKTNQIHIDELRKRLGVLPTEYLKMELFKRKILNFSIKEINDKTDIFVTYEQHKNGRKIIGFTFSFKNKKKEKNKPDNIVTEPYQENSVKPTQNHQVIIHTLTELQAKKYATKLKLHPKILEFFGALKDENAFYQKVYQVLTEPDRVNKKAQNVVFTALFRDTDYEYGGKIPQANS